MPKDSGPTVEDVLVTPELKRRPSRPRDYEAESRALVALADVMARSPDQVLQRLAETALNLCRAGSAGISVWDPDDDPKVFRWRATAGEFAPFIGEALPRQFSPCGTVLDRNSCLLMEDPVRFFPYISQLGTPVHEVLLVPFHEAEIPVGTVWVVAHDRDTHFDAEDERIITNLTKFAGAAVQMLRQIERAQTSERTQQVRDERFRALVNATSDVIYRMSADWSEMQPLDGRSLVASNPQPTRSWMQQNLPESEHERVLQAMDLAIRSKQTFELEHKFIRPDGAIGWTFSRAVPIFGAGGEIIEWFGAASDTTRRRQAEEELRDIRSRMEAALAAAAIGTWSWDVQADRFYGDESLARIFSVSAQEVDGGSITRLLESIHPDDRPRVAAAVDEAVQNGDSYECDYRISQEDGLWRWVSARGRVERDRSGRAIRFPGVVIDISDRKKAETELARVSAESERRKRLYEAILSSTPDFVYVFSLDHRILYANAALIAMWGYRPEDTIGKTFLDVGYEPWHAEMHCREIDQVRETKLPIRGEVPFHGTFGRRIYEYIFVPVIGEEGEVEAVAGTTRDVTERKRMEDELREADRKKDDFIALLAHELRNPLAPIRNGLQIIRLAGGDAASISDARAMMDRQLGHMVRLIDDLLDVSRISRNKMELRREPVLLSDIVGSAVEAVRPLVDAAGHTLTVELPGGPLVIEADHTRMAQVFGNILTNSIKYTRSGGRIELRAERRDGEVTVAIRDNGIGIPAECLPHVFNMFSQVDRSMERSTGGLGIGLALVKGLVEMHGGSVIATSRGEGMGTEIGVTLPAISVGPAAGPSECQVGTAQRRRLLVVDDNRDGAKSLAMMLRLLGNDVQTANDGIEAVELAQSFRPDAIFMDLGMPRMNGLDATREIKAAAWGARIAIFALTGWGQESDRVSSVKAGCTGHLVKPVEMSALQDVLQQL